jgi:hypothetical protein
MTDQEDQRPESTEEAAEIVEQDPALQKATDRSEEDEKVPEPTD